MTDDELNDLVSRVQAAVAKTQSKQVELDTERAAHVNTQALLSTANAQLQDLSSKLKAIIG